MVELKFDSNGLIPAIVQDHISKKVLMLAYMNKESLEITIKEGKTCFYSRSRQCLWRKGETSGNTQQVVSIRTDCDRDTLLIDVIKAGPATRAAKPASSRISLLPSRRIFHMKTSIKCLSAARLKRRKALTQPIFLKKELIKF